MTARDTDSASPPGSGGELILVSTPIGNLEDMTYRAVDTLKQVDAILAEDTRHSRPLLDRFGIKTRTVAYHDHNKERVTPGLIDRLCAGERLAVISDAGTPGIADPGFYIARAAVEAGIRVTAVPGASAILAALVVSGFPTDAFVFAGFPPKKKGGLARLAEALVIESRTSIHFVPPHQLVKFLTALETAIPERDVVVAREMTKLHEETRRGTPGALLAHFGTTRPRGEIVVLVKGVGKRPGARKPKDS